MPDISTMPILTWAQSLPPALPPEPGDERLLDDALSDLVERHDSLCVRVLSSGECAIQAGDGARYRLFAEGA